MSLLLTVYNTSAWKILTDSIGLPLINETTPVVHTKVAALQPIQELPTVSALLLGLSTGQALWVATVQAEHYLANAIENGISLADAAKAWELKTSTLLNLQRQQRKSLKLFNLHQALAQPNEFRELFSEVKIAEYSAQPTISNFPLLVACQYLAQQPELCALNIRLQASVLPLFDSEKLVLNLDQILLQNHSSTAVLHERDVVISQLHQVQEQLESFSIERDQLRQNLEKTKAEHLNEQKKASQSELQLKKVSEEFNKANQQIEKLLAELNTLQEKRSELESQLKTSSEERDLILNQLHQVQEQLEQYYINLQSEQQSNKHALLARDKQQAKEVTKLENEIRKTKARAANAEFSGQQLQSELNRVRKSISWKAGIPVRVIGRLIRKADPVREKLMQEVGLLLTSEYFDVDWYLRIYTDVAESQMNPAEHYLLYGAKEGRLPGPLFDGNWYLQHYPDVAATDSNPLLHFIMYGQQEGRSSSPLMLTNNQNTEDQA